MESVCYGYGRYVWKRLWHKHNSQLARWKGRSGKWQTSKEKHAVCRSNYLRHILTTFVQIWKVGEVLLQIRRLGNSRYFEDLKKIVKMPSKFLRFFSSVRPPPLLRLGFGCFRCRFFVFPPQETCFRISWIDLKQMLWDCEGFGKDNTQNGGFGKIYYSTSPKIASLILKISKMATESLWKLRGNFSFHNLKTRV